MFVLIRIDVEPLPFMGRPSFLGLGMPCVNDL